jgi:hypothetical protein
MQIISILLLLLLLLYTGLGCRAMYVRYFIATTVQHVCCYSPFNSQLLNKPLMFLTHLLKGTASKLTPAGGGSAGITVCCVVCICPLFVPYRVSIPLSRVSIPPVPLLLLLLPLPVLSLLPPTVAPTAAPTAAENDSARALCWCCWWCCCCAAGAALLLKPLLVVIRPPLRLLGRCGLLSLYLLLLTLLLLLLLLLCPCDVALTSVAVALPGGELVPGKLAASILLAPLQ